MNELYYDNLRRSCFYWSVGIFDFRSFHGTPKWVFQSCFLYVFLNTEKKDFFSVISFAIHLFRIFSVHFQFLSCHLWCDSSIKTLRIFMQIFGFLFQILPIYRHNFQQISTLRSIVFSALNELKQRRRNVEKKILQIQRNHKSVRPQAKAIIASWWCVPSAFFFLYRVSFPCLNDCAMQCTNLYVSLFSLSLSLSLALLNIVRV